MYNAQQCTGFVGTFSSQFSVLNWLNMTDFHKRSIPLKNLSPVPFNSHFAPNVSKWIVATAMVKAPFAFFRYKWLGLLKRIKLFYIGKDLHTHLDKHFQDHQSNHGKPAVLVLRERDVGFFSLFLQVINTLMSVDEENLDCTVHVEFGKNQSYFQGTNTWLDFFESIPNQDVAPSSSQLDQIEENYQLRLNQAAYWDEKGFIYSTESGVYWTGSYYPNLTPTSQSLYISHKTVPTEAERIRVAKIVGKYVVPNQEIREELRKFIEDNHIEGEIIGVQFRGTDARNDGRRAVPSYQVFIEAIEDQLKILKGYPIIVVASDEQAFIETIKIRFQNVKSYETIRHQSGDQIEGEGPQGGMMPMFVSENKNAALKGAIMDYLIISMANVLIHNLGSLSNAALLTNPQTKSILIGRNIS